MSNMFDLMAGLVADRMEAMEKQIADLQSQPRLQRVTPEAMAELEQRCASGVVVVGEYGARVLNYSQQYGHWWRDEWGAGIRVDRPWQGWFIELKKLKEVQQ